MANSNWGRTQVPLSTLRVGEVRRSFELEDQVAERIYREQLAFVDGCSACRSWYFGTGIQCERHGEH